MQKERREVDIFLQNSTTGTYKRSSNTKWSGVVAAFMLAIGVDPAAADKCYSANGRPMRCPPDTPYAKPMPEPSVNFTPWGNNPCPSYEASFRQCVDRNGNVSQCSSEEKRVIVACGKT